MKRAVCSPPQCMQPAGEVEQQLGIALRLPPLGEVGFRQRWCEREWLREQSRLTGSAEGQRGATCPKPEQFLHWVLRFEE